MDLWFLLFGAWVLIEFFLFMLQTKPSTEFDVNLKAFSIKETIVPDGTTSTNSSEISLLSECSYEDDSGIEFFGCKKRKIDEKYLQLLISQRLARQERDRKILQDYFDEQAHGREHTLDTSASKSTKSENEDGYESNRSAESIINANRVELIELLLKLTEHIRRHKFISIDQLSNRFKLKVQKLIEHLKLLQQIQIINGVIDDRGKFIFISETELTLVKQFIQKQHMPEIGLI